MARTYEEREASNVDSLTAPEQATPGAAVLHRRPILDSGASLHLFSDGRCLSNTRYPLQPKEITIADGRLVYAFEVGDLFTKDINLKNIYVVPELKMDLVSVRELARDGITTTFYENYAELRKGVQVVGKAIAGRDTSLYELTYLRATGDDASDTPPARSGSEPGMVAAAGDLCLPLPKGQLDEEWGKCYPDNWWMSQLFESLDEYPSLVSKDVVSKEVNVATII